jgi:hypothetical protein
MLFSGGEMYCIRFEWTAVVELPDIREGVSHHTLIYAWHYPHQKHHRASGERQNPVSILSSWTALSVTPFFSAEDVCPGVETEESHILRRTDQYSRWHHSILLTLHHPHVVLIYIPATHVDRSQLSTNGLDGYFQQDPCMVATVCWVGIFTVIDLRMTSRLSASSVNVSYQACEKATVCLAYVEEISGSALCVEWGSCI